jgi:hypothetical protein
MSQPDDFSATDYQFYALLTPEQRQQQLQDSQTDAATRALLVFLHRLPFLPNLQYCPRGIVPTARATPSARLLLSIG